MKKKKNPYVGGNWDDFVAEQKKDPAFAAAFQLEYDKLQLARQVRALREKKHMTQTELAEKIGTKQPSIARLEAGKVLPRLDLLERIAFALGVGLEIRFKSKAV